MKIFNESIVTVTWSLSNDFELSGDKKGRDISNLIVL